MDGAATPPAGKPPRSPAWMYAGLGAALAGFYGIAQALVEVREGAAAREHGAALVSAAAEPGRLVTDPLLPAGVVEVDLAAAAPDLEPHEPATVRVGARRSAWSPESPARFEGLARDRRHAVAITGPYLAEGVSFAVPTGAHGARLAVRAIPIDPWQAYSAAAPGQTPEKVLEIDLTRLDALAVVWKVGPIVVSETTVPRPPGPALAARVRDEWKQQGGHRDPADRKLDQAIVRVASTTPFDAIFPVAEAILATRRDLNRAGAVRSIPAFNVSVQVRP
jgi:hypothetical protein